MCSVSTFLSTLPVYLLSQDSQPSTTSHRQKLTMQDTQSCPVLHMMDSSTSHPVIYSGYRQNFQQKEPVCPQYKEATVRSKATQPSSASHRCSFPCTTSRL